MQSFRLKLVGRPTLYVDNIEVQIRPRAVFELMAVVILAGDQGISRRDVATRLWGHLGAQHCRVQLRIAIHKLTEELDSLQGGNWFELRTDQLRFIPDCEADIRPEQHFLPRNALDIERLLLPIAEGWNQEHWESERDRFGELLADCFERIPSSESGLLKTLLKAVEIYPTTVRINLSLLKLLKSQNRDSEYNQLVVTFEDKWIDRFGRCDVPDLTAPEHHTDDSNLENVPSMSRYRISVTNAILLILVAASVSGLAVRSVIGSAVAPLRLRVDEIKHIELDGIRLRFVTIDIQEGHVNSFREFSDGTFSAADSESGLGWEYAWNQRGQLTRLRTERVALLDRMSGSLLRLEGQFAVYEPVGLNSTAIHPTAELPRFGGGRIIGPNSFLLNRVCSHLARDHNHSSLFADGVEHPLDSGLGNVQVSVWTTVCKDRIYAKFSYGKSDGWKYHTFSYSPATNVATLLELPPVAAVSSDGARATLPEETDLQLGDYDTHWNHTVKIFPPNAKPFLLQFQGLHEFYWFGHLGNLIVAARSNHGLQRGFTAFDFHGREIPSITKKLATLHDLQQLGDGKALLGTTREPNQLILIEAE